MYLLVLKFRFLEFWLLFSRIDPYLYFVATNCFIRDRRASSPSPKPIDFLNTFTQILRQPLFSIVERSSNYVSRDSLLGMSATQNYAIRQWSFKTKCCFKTKSKGIVCTVANKTPQQYIENEWGYLGKTPGATTIITSAPTI